MLRVSAQSEAFAAERRLLSAVLRDVRARALRLFCTSLRDLESECVFVRTIRRCGRLDDHIQQSLSRSAAAVGSRARSVARPAPPSAFPASKPLLSSWPPSNRLAGLTGGGRRCQAPQRRAVSSASVFLTRARPRAAPPRRACYARPPPPSRARSGPFCRRRTTARARCGSRSRCVELQVAVDETGRGRVRGLLRRWWEAAWRRRRRRRRSREAGGAGSAERERQRGAASARGAGGGEERGRGGEGPATRARPGVRRRDSRPGRPAGQRREPGVRETGARGEREGQGGGGPPPRRPPPSFPPSRGLFERGGPSPLAVAAAPRLGALPPYIPLPPHTVSRPHPHTHTPITPVFLSQSNASPFRRSQSRARTEIESTPF